MSEQDKIISTTPATVKAFIVDCGRDCGDGSFVYHYEPVIAWVHTVSSDLLGSYERSSFPMTVNEGVHITEYAIYFPEDDFWHYLDGTPDMPGSRSSQGKESLEKHLAQVLEKEESEEESE